MILSALCGFEQLIEEIGLPGSRSRDKPIVAKFDLVITQSDEESIITVDNLAIAQFVYLILNNPNIRQVIETIAAKAVLILGRFTEERKAVFDGIGMN